MALSDFFYWMEKLYFILIFGIMCFYLILTQIFLSKNILLHINLLLTNERFYSRPTLD